MLTLAQDGGISPYAWAGAAIPAGGRVLDLCCGSAPMRAHLHPDLYVGMDLSAAELQRAVGGVVQADAGRLPLANGAVDVVMMSMALQLVPWEQTLTEVARVLRSGGLFVATVPVNQPLSAADWLRYGRLSVALRHKVAYPNDEALAAFAGTQELLAVSDESRAFFVNIGSQDEADLLLDSLYVPGVSAVRIAAGRKVVAKWVGQRVAVPIRRIVLSRA